MFQITYKARGFSASEFLHGQKRFKPLSEQIALCQAMAVWLELYQIPLIHIATYQKKSSLLNICNRIETYGKLANSHAEIPYLGRVG